MLLFKRNRLAIILLLIVEFIFSQQYPSKNFSTLDGLSNNSVYSILKDSRGILWVGTANGVSSIENGIIKNYFESDGMASNNCWDIIEDNNKNIWFGSHGGGITLYNGEKFIVINESKGLVNNSIRRLFIYKRYIYVGTENGISIINIDTKKIVNIKGDSSKGSFQVMDFFESKSKIYLGTNKDGCWAINDNNRKLTFIKTGVPNVFSIHKNRNDLLICVGGVDGNCLKKITVDDFVSNKQSKKSIGNTVFWDFVTNKKQETYGVGNGINFPTGGIFKITGEKTINLSKAFGIDSVEFWSVFYDDKNEILYVGTLDKGLYLIDLKQQLNYYPSSFFDKPKLEIISINKINQSKVILHKDGVLLLNKSKIIKEISSRDFFNFSQRRILSNPTITKYIHYSEFHLKKINDIEFRILKIINDEIFVNTTIGIFVIDKKGDIIDYHPTFSGEFTVLNKNELFFQKPFSFVTRIQNPSKSHLITDFDINNQNNPRDVFSILSVNNKHYFISTSRGLFLYQDFKFKSYEKNGIWLERTLSQVTVNDKNQLVIANTYGDVFVIEDKSKFKIIQKIDRKELIGTSISFLKCYKDYILIGTEKGLNIYKNGIIRLLDEEQGLKNKVFTSAFLDGKTLSIGTHDGYFELDLEKYLYDKTNLLDIKISKIEVDYKALNKSEYSWGDYKNSTIKIPYDKNTLSITYQPKKTEYPEKLFYRYRLSGMKTTKWSDWSKTTNINLTYLPIGKFLVQLEVKNLYSGTVSLHNILNITVVPPFWKTWWFIIGSMIFFSIVGFVVYKKRIHLVEKRERAKATIQKRLVETKMEALQSQMNPHFIFNAMNSIQNYIIDNNVDDALMYMGEFSKLIRQTLNNSSQQRINLKDEIRYLKSYITLENMRFKNKIHFVLDIDANLDLSEIEIPPMLVQPFIENVFVHAFDSNSKDLTLLISLKQIENYLLFEIKDNGKGMASENLNKLNISKGIKLAKERIALFQSETTNAVMISSSAKGTTVVLKLQIILD